MESGVLFSRHPGLPGRFPFVNPTNQPDANPSRKQPWRVLIGLALTLVSGGAALAAGGDTNRFVVLELKVTASEVSVVGATEVAGQPKPQPAKVGIDFEIRGGDNAVVFSGQVANPRLQSLCYEHPPGSGQMTNNTATLDEGYLTLKVPSNPAATTIEFFESRRPGPSLQSLRRSLGKTALRRP